MKNPEVAELREALRQLLTDMFIAQGNMRDAAKRDPAWEGCAEAIQPRVDAARAALEKYPEASAISEGDVETVSLPAKEWNAMAFWLGRCEDKGHLERCSDLMEPWEELQAAILAMDSRRSSTAPMQSEEMTMESRTASLDGCTDPYNCRRCSAPVHARDGLHHAGIPFRSSDIPENIRYKQVAGSGNCMQCSMAFMLGLRIDQVPDFAASGSPQQCWELFESFAASQGYSAVMIPGNRSFEADYLVSGTSPRGTPHMVVMNDGRLVHDPHPSNAGLSDVQCVWLLARRSLAAEDAEAKVARPNFGGRPYPEIGELVQDLNNCINEYVGQIPLAAAIGALRIVEHGLLQPEESP